ncbi:MAG TPA: CPBP family intramembrane glutamic endopeptidase [Planctomycetota bacterium]|nr:CPBP family intramembrane glutamic endopeptidase [Planctomycetota bacterium]
MTMDPAGSDLSPPPADCASCGRPLKPEAAFCSACGHRRGDPPVDRRKVLKAKVERVRRFQSGWDGVHSLILFYLLLLGGQAASFVVARASDEFVADVAGTAILSLIVLIVAVRHRQDVKGACGRPGWGPAGYGLVLIASVPILIVVCSYAYGVGRLFHLSPASVLDPFRGHSLVWAYLLVAVLPPIFEELGFRGVMFPLLSRSLDPKETILLTAVAFGLLHLSIPTLITHVPLGLYLGWLRYRSGSLYPSIFAHFLHNGLVLTAEAAGWLPRPG